MKSPGYFALPRAVPRFVANFDSATAMLRALARYLRGEDFPGLGLIPPITSHVTWVNHIPRRLIETGYTWAGWVEGIPRSKTGDVPAEAFSRWVVSEYARRPYQAVAIGSSNGAAVHLCAALGIPWLPQTFLIPVRQPGIHPDEPRQALSTLQAAGEALLEANPDLQLHHMRDPNQDHLMIQHMAYFRVKRLRLGPTYEQFLIDVLPPGGTIFVLDCRQTWPTTHVTDRYIFQHGAMGGATTAEYFQGSARVADFLRRQASHRERWDPPEPDGERPEAEWGFEPTLAADIERFARDRGYRIRRIVFDHPEDLSPLVADLYRREYAQRQMLANRLLVESFAVIEPWWAARTGSVPFWTIFSTEPSAERVEQYLADIEPFDDIYMTLFSHGIESVGWASIERWRAILRRARRLGSFVGVDEKSFPRDFATFVRYHTALKQIPARYPAPPPLPLDQFDAFVQQAGDHYRVHWLEPRDVAPTPVGHQD